jgi:antirestriction protein ArdC
MPVNTAALKTFAPAMQRQQIHSTGHESRLKRDLGGAFGKAR